MPSARSRPRIFNNHIVIIHDPELLAAYLSGRHLTLAYFGWYWYFTQMGSAYFTSKQLPVIRTISDFIRFHYWLGYQNYVVLTGVLSMERDKSQMVVATVKRSKHQFRSLWYFDVNEPQPPAL